MRNRRNYYRVLHVQPDAPAAVLKSSYRALMLTLEMHPDRGGEHWNAALINEAYATLSDPQRRAEYDRSLDSTRSRSGRQPAERDDRSQSDCPRPRPTVEPDTQCLFCGSESGAADHGIAEGVCGRCGSPLTPAGAPQLLASGRRAARRIARTGEIVYYTDWHRIDAHPARISDLSPGGLRFTTDRPIARFQIVKIEGALLEAVVRVVDCRKTPGPFSIGAQFYTVRFHERRGTFLSTGA